MKVTNFANFKGRSAIFEMIQSFSGSEEHAGVREISDDWVCRIKFSFPHGMTGVIFYYELRPRNDIFPALIGNETTYHATAFWQLVILHTVVFSVSFCPIENVLILKVFISVGL